MANNKTKIDDVTAAVYKLMSAEAEASNLANIGHCAGVLQQLRAMLPSTSFNSPNSAGILTLNKHEIATMLSITNRAPQRTIGNNAPAFKEKMGVTVGEIDPSKRKFSGTGTPKYEYPVDLDFYSDDEQAQIRGGEKVWLKTKEAAAFVGMGETSFRNKVGRNAELAQECGQVYYGPTDLRYRKSALASCAFFRK